MNYNIPRIMIAADRSGSGKTAICSMISLALRQKGYKVSMFKCGPDYLDPLFHEKVCGTKPGNLDSFFCDEDELSEILYTESEGCDIAVTEGVMGYYDGRGDEMAGSSAQLAHLCSMPVVLVVDAKGAMQSILASIHGFLTYHEYGKNIRGVILNRASRKVFEALKKPIEAMRIRALGYVSMTKELTFGSRYLGVETPEDDKVLSGIKEASKNAEIDYEGLVELAKEAEPFSVRKEKSDRGFSGLRVAIAKDEAFCFVYKENIELLKSFGAEILYFSPIHEKSVPECDALIFPGGYPEDYAAGLSENESMKASVREAVFGGIPTIAECGGFLYFHENLTTVSGDTYKMAGVLEGSCRYKGLCKGFGYKEFSADKNWLLGKQGDVIRAHEFHHFESDAEPVMTEKLYAGFSHIPFAGNRNALISFLEAAL